MESRATAFPMNWRLSMKVGDLVRLRDMGMPNQDKTIGIVREIRSLKLEGGAWKSEEWDSVLIYWKENTTG